MAGSRHRGITDFRPGLALSAIVHYDSPASSGPNIGAAMGEPWEDWIPGVLNRDQMEKLWQTGHIITEKGSLEQAVAESKSAIDLSLSDAAYIMRQGSVKPPGTDRTYDWFIKHEGLADPIDPSSDGTFTLKAKKTYVFKQNEQLNSTGLSAAGFHGQATAKSSVGRVDVLARLIVDGMDTYERFDPDGLRKCTGGLYLEITPITFNVRVKPGISLSQLRFFYGKPEDAVIGGELLFKTALTGPGGKQGSLTVDLSNTKKGGLDVAAFYNAASDATGNSQDDPIPLWRMPNVGDRPKPCKYWKLMASDETRRLKVEQNQFYILRSKEKIAVPPGVAIYCRASDETIGEMRIHYAGFVHPMFGKCRSDSTKGTPLTFELRGHQVDVTLTDGEKLANLTFYRMSSDHTPMKGDKTSYDDQELELSSFFGPWPERLRRNDDDTVEPA
jgi:dCTP deaminase